jgi:hypothetical protein
VRWRSVPPVHLPELDGLEAARLGDLLSAYSLAYLLDEEQRTIGIGMTGSVAVDSPISLVQLAVVKASHQDAVSHVRTATDLPSHDVVRVGEGRR